MCKNKWKRALALLLVAAFLVQAISNIGPLLLTAQAETADEMSLLDLEWESATGFNNGMPNKNADCDGNPAQVAGTPYTEVLGVHPVNDSNTNGDIVYDIEGMGYVYFETLVGKTDGTVNPNITFSILVDGVEKIHHTMTGGEAAKKLAVSVKDAKKITLRINCTGDGFYNDASVWINPILKKSYPDELSLVDYAWESASGFNNGEPRRHKDCDGNPAQVAGVSYTNLLGVHPVNDSNTNGDIVYDIEGLGYTRFETLVGKTNMEASCNVNFSVLVDGVEKASYAMKGGDAARKISVSVAGAKKITLRINCTTDGFPWDASAWINPTLRKNFADEKSLLDLEWESATGFNNGVPNKKADCNGAPAQVAGDSYSEVLGVHPVNDSNTNGDIVYDITGMGYVYFETFVGKTDNTVNPQITFSILVDGVEKIHHTMTGGETAKKLAVSVKDAKEITLRINCTGDGYFNDASVWINPILKKSYPDELSLVDYAWESASGFNNGEPRRHKDCDGNPIQVAGEAYEKGLGIHAVNDTNVNGDIVYDIAGSSYKCFEALIGKTNPDPNFNVAFSVLVDDVEKFSYTMNGAEKAKKVMVLVEDAETLTLRINCTSDGYPCDASVWINPLLTKQMPEELSLVDLSWTSANGFLMPPRKNADCDGNPIQVGGTAYTVGIGAHPVGDKNVNGDIVYDIEGLGYDCFETMIGKSNPDPNFRVTFSVLVDDREEVTHIMTGADNAKKLVVPLSGAKKLTLRINCGDDGHPCDASVWLNPTLKKSMPDTVYLSDMGWNREETIPAGAGSIYLDKNNDGGSAVVGGTTYEHVIGTHAIEGMENNQDIIYDIEGLGYTYFEVATGIQDQGEGAPGARFSVLVDGVETSKRFASMNNGVTQKMRVDVTDAKKITLRVNCSADNYNNDMALWINPILMTVAPDVPTISNTPDVQPLTELDWAYAEGGTGIVGKDTNIYGEPLKIGNKTYEKGLGTHAFDTNYPSDIIYDITGMGYKILSVDVGIDEVVGNGGSVVFQVLGDGEILAESSTISGSLEPINLFVAVENISEITLRVLNADGSYNSDQADWGEPTLYKDISLMPSYLKVNGLYNGMRIFEDNITLTGLCQGVSELKIHVDEQEKLVINSFDGQEWIGTINGLTVGKHDIKFEVVKEGRVEITQQYEIEVVEFTPIDSVVLESQTTKATLEYTDNAMIVSSLANKSNGQEWLATVSEVSFPRTISVSGVKKEIDWKFEKKTESTKDGVKTIAFKYSCDTYGLVLESAWMSYPESEGPVRHAMNMYNAGDNDITVFSVPSLSLNLKGQANENVELMSVHKGGFSPMGIEYDDITSSFSKNIFTRIGGVNDPLDAHGGYIPFAGIQVAEQGLYVGLEWSECRTLIEGSGIIADEQTFQLTNGLNSAFYTIIPQGETYMIPPTFIGCYEGNRDAGSNQMKDWYDEFLLTDKVADERGGALEFNMSVVQWEPRGSWLTAVDKRYFSLVEQLKTLGFEEIVLDIGWNNEGVFGPALDRWPNGMTKHSEYAHEANMLLGVYFRPWNGSSRIEGALTDVEGFGDSEWFVSDGYGVPIDLGNTEAVEVLKKGIYNMITEGNLDLWRTDFNPIVCTSSRVNRHSNDTDVAYWSTRGFYEVGDYLKANIPDFGIELCSTGGTLQDFGNLQRVIRTPGCDVFWSIPMRQAFYDVSYAFPAKQIGAFMSDIQNGIYEPDDNYRFRSALLGSPIYTLMLPEEMPDDEYKCFARTIEIYKEWIQDLVIDGSVYHILPRPDGTNWDGMEYFDEDTGKGAVLVFKPGDVENTKVVKLDGLDTTKEYHVWSEDGTVAYAVVSGAELMNEGVTFQLEGTHKSEILYIQEKGKDDAEVTAPSEFGVDGDSYITVDTSNSVTVQWDSAKLADSYEVSLLLGGNEVARKNTTETFATFDGLQADKEYSWTVTAINKFGKTQMTGNPKINADGLAYIEKLSNLNISGDFEKGSLEANGVIYLDAIEISCDDVILSENGDKTITVTLEKGAGYKTLAGTLALKENVNGEQVNVTLETDLGVTKTVLLNANDVERNISLDVQNAEKVTITIKNISKDILTQSEHLTSKYTNGTNPYPSYYRILHDTAGDNYVFSADVMQTKIGALDTNPRYGIWAGYVDEGNFVGAYLDQQYNLFTTIARIDDKSAGIMHYELPDDFNHREYHTISVYRDGDVFKMYLDGELKEIRELDLPESKPGLSVNDTLVKYKNIVVEGDEFRPEESVGGVWTGLSPVVVFGGAHLYDEVISIQEDEPQLLPEDVLPEIDKNAVLSTDNDKEEGRFITFDKESDYDLFDYYSSSADLMKLVDEKLVSTKDGEQKAIYNEYRWIKSGSIQADIGIAEVGGAMNGGLYIAAKDAKNSANGITAININLESDAASRDLKVKIHRFEVENGWIGCTKDYTLTNYFKDGDTKASVNVRVEFDDEHMSIYIDNDLYITFMNQSISDYTIGSVGLRSQVAAMTYDNIRIIANEYGTPDDSDLPQFGDNGAESKQYVFDSVWDALDFDFYHSSKGGFTISNGKLTPAGDEGEFKAILRGNDRSYKTVSVDIYPGAKGTINSGLYIGAKGAGHAVDKINALGILIQSDFEGWEDAANRLDIIVGEFSDWKELSRTISETGENNALFTNGEKEPVNLRVDIDGNKLTITVSLLSDPTVYVQTVYEYTGKLDLEHGAVGIRSMFDDCSFDNFKVSYDKDASGNDSNKDSTGNNVHTGDDNGTNIIFAVVMMVLALGVILLVTNKRRKNQNFS